MASKTLYSFPARMESLPALLQALRQDAAAAPEDVVLRAQTALEELLTNSVTHGHASAQTGSQVGLSVRCHGGAVYLRYEDDLAAFDPADKLREALQRTENPLDQRPPGGLGLLMVYRLADEFRYARDGERNCLDLAFQVRPVLS